jgi:dTDP-4-amino-4,6-dideoxygalactose transaminase
MSFEIPLTETTLGEEEVEAAARVLRSRWLTQGAEVAAFEEEFAAAMGTRHAVAVANGTLALEILFAAADLGPGDEVILPALTFVACLNVTRRCGAIPVLADVESPDSLLLSVDHCRRLITPRTRAIVAMPHAGFAPDMAALEALCAERGLVLIEDACHAPLATVAGRPIGTFGRGAAWSFFGNKNMTTGEGGMITTNDDATASRCRLLRSHGITRSTWDRARGHASDYDVAAAGTNARLDEVRAAIGRVQLGKLAAATAARAAAAARLRAALATRAIPGLEIPYAHHRGTPAHHLFCVLLPPGTDRAAVMAAMRAAGVQTSIHYPLLHQFTSTAPLFDGTKGRADGLAVAEAIAPRLLTLPLAPQHTAAHADRIAAALAAALENG